MVSRDLAWSGRGASPAVANLALAVLVADLAHGVEWHHTQQATLYINYPRYSLAHECLIRTSCNSVPHHSTQVCSLLLVWSQCIDSAAEDMGTRAVVATC